jgi:heparan-alpha-glucosaminide N-acetyltransferase
MINQLSSQRILSIDALRGITILVMIFVNELAGVSGIPAWMKHMPADADAMTFVDVVFPAFLFIVGMSIPFAINRRLSKGDNFVKLQGHILWRSLGLLVLGFFMVNAEDGYNEAAMGMSIYAWSLLFYVCVILVWNVYSFSQQWMVYLLKGIGVAGLIMLAFIYKGGEDGTEHMQPHWWGILGLIGWAYLYSCIIYQLFKGNAYGILAMIAVCVIFYAVAKQPAVQQSAWSWMAKQSGNAAHVSIVLSGMLLSLIFFDQDLKLTRRQRYLYAAGFTILLLIAGYFLRPYFKISKIYATPTWCLYSAAICCILFCFLYWLIDIKHQSKWTNFFRPAAANPLLTYIVPFVIYALLHLLHIKLPAVLQSGITGLLWCVFYAVVVMGIAKGLNKAGIKLQL